MFTIIYIIIIIIWIFHARVCPWLQDNTKSSVLCLPQIRVKADIECQLVVQGHSPCSGSFVHIVRWRSLSIFHSVSGFLIAVSKAHRRSSPVEALATWQNKYNWFDVARKKTSLEWHLLVQIAIPFKIQYLFQKCFKVPTEKKCAYPTTTK